ncbi:PP0621 family protein [Paraburkholderia kururiensis]|uniref:PP0621 family protein n=1 Tax=Paraburkholderia kururiensis TaxID=984307 RepID=A0ABZ0WEL3_9BURK|nr:PP0621 family protein [Paraburkholderia kururiensis]WQD75792.1 PP0621 family protein [Paraburkholderia kururiensis]
MRQIFLLILLFVVGQWLAKALRRVDARPADRAGAGGGNAAGQQSDTASRRAGSTGTRLAEPMVRCTECGVHVPNSESVVAAGQPFCCEEHARRHVARTSAATAQPGSGRTGGDTSAR